ncbi:extracellular calcium-sensing receptor-like [Discoglossus pictus]
MAYLKETFAAILPDQAETTLEIERAHRAFGENPRAFLRSDLFREPQKRRKRRFNLRTYQFIQLMIFAIEEINKNNELLPNVTLGYRIYDGCISHMQAVRAALSMTTGVGHSDYNCTQLPLVPAIIAASKSTQSIAISTAVGIFKMPVISYFSTCACLSRKHDYPTFLRTVPSDLFQSQALAQLVNHFKWSWIGIITQDNDYGLEAVRVFKEEALQLGICVAFTELLTFLKHVNFTTVAGDKVTFDENGDPDPSYDLVNWQRSSNGSLLFVRVGEFSKEHNLRVNEDLVVWQGSQIEVPISVCSESCLPGSRKAVQLGKHSCCFDCIPCGNGEISNQSNSLECMKCPIESWSNKQRNQCVLKELEYISFKETLGTMLFSGALLGIFLTICITAIFAYHRHSPILRANNSQLSFCILVSIALCFISSVAFLGQPTNLSCMLRHTGFGITFAFCISCILGKTIVVLIAFNVQHPDKKLSLFFSPTKQKILIFLSTTFQFIVCTAWNIISPPCPVKRITGDTPTILLACDTGSLVAFSLVLGYIWVLVCICLTLAFCVRNLPYHYNEAKFITFSMVIFSAVWITFIPAYLSSPGKYLEAIEMFAILGSSFGLLLCIFAPKCYFILLKPEKNNRKYMRSKTSS